MATNKKDVSEQGTPNTAAETAVKESTPYAGVTCFAYAGPSLPGGRLKSLAVLRGTYAQITAYFKDTIAQYPSIRRLIVPVSQLAQTLEQTQNSGNLMYNSYRDIAAAIQAKGEK